jgi:hypothetical protein
MLQRITYEHRSNGEQSEQAKSVHILPPSFSPEFSRVQRSWKQFAFFYLKSGKSLSFPFRRNSLSQFGNDTPRSAIAIANYETWLAPLQKNGSGRFPTLG